MTREQLLQLQSVARLYQERYDRAFESWGLKAPAPAFCDSAEAVNDYRREQAVRAKKLLPLSETRVAPTSRLSVHCGALSTGQWMTASSMSWSRRLFALWQPQASVTTPCAPSTPYSNSA
jgi:hypothetical protein